MSISLPTLITFIAYLVAMLAIGATTKFTKKAHDYLTIGLNEIAEMASPLSPIISSKPIM